jgi:hypothetical protein
MPREGPMVCFDGVAKVAIQLLTVFPSREFCLVDRKTGTAHVSSEPHEHRNPNLLFHTVTIFTEFVHIFSHF